MAKKRKNLNELGIEEALGLSYIVRERDRKRAEKNLLKAKEIESSQKQRGKRYRRIDRRTYKLI